MRRLAKVMSVAAFAVVLLTVAAGGAGAWGGPAPVVPPPARVGGLTYGQWSGVQWSWELSAADDPTHPVVDPNPGTPAQPELVNCSLGQVGNVWFLAGTTYAQPFTTTYRSCKVPSGRFLFFPLVDAWADNLSCPGTPNTTLTADELRTEVAQIGDSVDTTSLHASVDGQPVRNLSKNPGAFRVGPTGSPTDFPPTTLSAPSPAAHPSRSGRRRHHLGPSPTATTSCCRPCALAPTSSASAAA